ncbi:MAG: DMT family transporter [Hyphomicrobiales bacterium]
MSVASVQVNPLWPNLGVGLAGVIWGCFWIPARYFDANGLSHGLMSTALFAVTVLALLPWALWRFRPGASERGPLIRIALLAGTAYAFYANSLILTEVVRALLLFYLTPIWGTVLGILLLGERLFWSRVLAIGLGLGGALVILGLDHGAPLPRNTGDWMALVSGMVWAYACVGIARSDHVPASSQMFAWIFGAFVMSSLVVLLLAPGTMAMPQWSPKVVLAFLAFALIINLPCMAVVVWGARLLSPGRVGILLCGEIAFGVLSAAILTDEPFGAREMIGTALILSAVLVEVLGTPRSAPAPST